MCSWSWWSHFRHLYIRLVVRVKVQFQGLVLFELAKTLLLGLKGIDRGIFNTLACLPFNSLMVVVFLVDVLLNCDNTHCLKVLFSLLAINLSHPDLQIANKNSQATKPKSAICKIFLVILLSKYHCLMNTVILIRRHIIFLMFLAKYLSISDKEIEQK